MDSCQHNFLANSHFKKWKPTKGFLDKREIINEIIENVGRRDFDPGEIAAIIIKHSQKFDTNIVYELLLHHFPLLRKEKFTLYLSSFHRALQTCTGRKYSKDHAEKIMGKFKKILKDLSLISIKKTGRRVGKEVWRGYDQIIPTINASLKNKSFLRAFSIGKNSKPLRPQRGMHALKQKNIQQYYLDTNREIEEEINQIEYEIILKASKDLIIQYLTKPQGGVDNSPQGGVDNSLKIEDQRKKFQDFIHNQKSKRTTLYIIFFITKEYINHNDMPEQFLHLKNYGKFLSLSKKEAVLKKIKEKNLKVNQKLKYLEKDIKKLKEEIIPLAKKQLMFSERLSPEWLAKKEKIANYLEEVKKLSTKVVCSRVDPTMDPLKDVGNLLKILGECKNKAKRKKNMPCIAKAKKHLYSFVQNFWRRG